ncbi:MAG: hypothetical protein ACJARR_001952 [Pseudophaeobacter arcticus]
MVNHFAGAAQQKYAALRQNDKKLRDGNLLRTVVLSAPMG